MELAYLSREQVRRVDEVAINKWGIPGAVLMENAGRGVADVMCGLGVSGKVVIACAKGNNGGDGFVLARHLALRDCDVAVLLCCDADELRGDAKATYKWLTRCEVPICDQDTIKVPSLLEEAEWAVDALLGTGAQGSPRPPLDGVIEQMNAADCRRLAIDLPSGLDCDTGEPSQITFRAEHTCTFVAPKLGMQNENSAPYVGQLHTLDIGVPWRMVLALL